MVSGCACAQADPPFGVASLDELAEYNSVASFVSLVLKRCHMPVRVKARDMVHDV